MRDLKIEIVATNSGEGLSLLKEGACDFMICYADRSNINRVGDDILSGIKIAETEIVQCQLLKQIIRLSIQFRVIFHYLLIVNMLICANWSIN